jgi:hypothetical protein
LIRWITLNLFEDEKKKDSEGKKKAAPTGNQKDKNSKEIEGGTLSKKQQLLA